MSNISELRLGIDSEMVSSACKAVADFWEEPDLVATVVKVRMVEMMPAQPYYVCYLRDMGLEIGMNNALTYASAALLTYEMIPLGHKLHPLSETDIESTKLHLREGILEQNDKGTKIDIRWLLEKISEDSPAFVEWLLDKRSSLPDEAKSDFILGSLFAVAPFYSRVEMQNLALNFKG